MRVEQRPPDEEVKRKKKAKVLFLQQAVLRQFAGELTVHGLGIARLLRHRSPGIPRCEMRDDTKVLGKFVVASARAYGVLNLVPGSDKSWELTSRVRNRAAEFRLSFDSKQRALLF